MSTPAHDAETEALRQRLADLEASIDTRVSERFELIRRARMIASLDYAGTDSQIRAQAVAAARGHGFIEQRSEADIATMFEALADHAAESAPSLRLPVSRSVGPARTH